MKRSVRMLALLTILAMAFAGLVGAQETPFARLKNSLIVHAAKPYDTVIAGIEELGGTVTIQYQNADAVAAQVPADKYKELLALPGVNRVEKDHVVTLPPAPDESLQPTVLNMDGMELLDAAGVKELIGAPPTYYSYLSDVTGAQDTWTDTGAGADSIVALIDTGTYPDSVCLPARRVIAGPDFSPDAGGPFDGSTRPDNHWHGTFVAGVIAADGCAIRDVAGGVFDTHLPPEAKIPVGPYVLVPLHGIAPASSIYAVKAFPHTGAAVSSSIIDAALDHVITVKNSGTLDIDVVVVEAAGVSLNDGRTLQEQLIDLATDAGMTVVVPAGNEGPAPNSVSLPGTAFSALTVGAASDPVHTRIFWDIVYGPGQGVTMYPINEIRPADFSGRGPYGDGRAGPDVLATGVFNLSLFTPATLGFASGTSFSTPVVAGAAALLDAWAEDNNPSIGPRAIRNAIIDGAVPLDAEWSELAQGSGYVNVSNSLDLLKSGRVNNGLRHDHVGGLKPNLRFTDGETREMVELGPGRTVDWVFNVDEETERVEIDVDVIGGPVAPGPGALPNSFRIYVKSAKRGGAPYVIRGAFVFDDASVVVGDGYATVAGLISRPPPQQWPMEPGLMKVTLEASWTNSAPILRAAVTIRRVQVRPGNKASGVRSTIGKDEYDLWSTVIPPGIATATFELSWKHDWSKFPTKDLDMFFVSPSSFPFVDYAYLDGVYLNSPERQVISDPEPGTWYIFVDGRLTVEEGRDPYRLVLTVEE